MSSVRGLARGAECTRCKVMGPGVPGAGVQGVIVHVDLLINVVYMYITWMYTYMYL